MFEIKVIFYRDRSLLLRLNLVFLKCQSYFLKVECAFFESWQTFVWPCFLRSSITFLRSRLKSRHFSFFAQALSTTPPKIKVHFLSLTLELFTFLAGPYFSSITLYQAQGAPLRRLRKTKIGLKKRQR